VLAGRTPDLRIANATLSQLSYVPEFSDYYTATATLTPKEETRRLSV
jgi:hypothetical protein